MTNVAMTRKWIHCRSVNSRPSPIRKNVTATAAAEPMTYVQTRYQRSRAADFPAPRAACDGAAVLRSDTPW
jgi:hypothetical protein